MGCNVAIPLLVITVYIATMDPLLIMNEHFHNTISFCFYQNQKNLTLYIGIHNVLYAYKYSIPGFGSVVLANINILRLHVCFHIHIHVVIKQNSAGLTVHLDNLSRLQTLQTVFKSF